MELTDLSLVDGLEKALPMLRYDVGAGGYQEQLTEIIRYYELLRGYEPILYGSDPFYRDHFAHVLRVWLTGILVISRLDPNQLIAPRLTTLSIDRSLFTTAELSAMYTVAALTHDM